MLKFAFPPTQNIKFAFPPTQNHNASQWNIGYVGSMALGLCVGHVHFIFFVLISFPLGSRRKHSFQWNMGFRFGHFVLFKVLKGLKKGLDNCYGMLLRKS